MAYSKNFVQAFLSVIVLFPSHLLSRNSFGIGTTTPDQNAVLDLVSEIDFK